MDEKILMIFGGVGLFLFGMHLLESALSQFATRDFKLILRRNTGTNPRAFLSGVVTTAILQSSSVVSFITLAFVGSGIIMLHNAFAVLLGANIGTAIANFVIATLGFTMNIEVVWYPLLGIAGILLVAFESNKKIHQICSFAIGFSFLFIALSFMKNGMLDSVRNFDLSPYATYPPVVFVIIGFIMTLLIQSSSATVAITLSALYAKAISFDLAVAIVVGSELGTALKLLLGTAGGFPEKKRLALGSIILNLLTTVFATLFIYPLIRLVTVTMNVNDPLIGLVVFQTIINLFSAFLFLPFVNPFSRFLGRFYKKEEKRSSLYIDARVPMVAAFAMEIFRLEVFYFLKRVLAYNSAEFRNRPEDSGLIHLLSDKEWENEKRFLHETDRYDAIKKAQGEIMEYYVHMQKNITDPDQINTINQYIRSVHNAMHAAKSYKDISHNKNELLQSVHDVKYAQFSIFSDTVARYNRRLAEALSHSTSSASFEDLALLLQEIQTGYNDLLNSIYEATAMTNLSDKDISTLQNMNRELYSANKSMIFAIGDFTLTGKESEGLKSIPLTIR